MDHGILRYEVRLIQPDGTEMVLETEATPHRCVVLENRMRRLRKLGYNGELKSRVSKVLLGRLS